MKAITKNAKAESCELFHESSYCWVKDAPPARNQFVSFEHQFDFDANGKALLHLFADTRYRLWVNETFIAYGPGRFVTAYPEYDSHDLTSHLVKGANLIRVEVNFYGSSSYQSMPDGMPGFIAAGGISGTAICFNTPDEWKARVHHAWDPRAPLFSFAQNPAEICDTRMLALELGKPADASMVPLSAKDTPWKHLSPRSVPVPDYKMIHPAQILVAAPLDEPLRWGMQFIADAIRDFESDVPREHMQFSTWIHSPREQLVVMDCFWSTLALNGDSLVIDYSQNYGNHGAAHLKLREGWNFLAGHFEHLGEYWSYLVGLPREAEASLHAKPDLNCAHAFACSPQCGHPSIPPCPTSPESHVIPKEWVLRSGSLDRITPARLVAWDRPTEAYAVRLMPYGQLVNARSITARAAVWSFDYQDEYYGHAVVDVEAPPGSILDVAYDDWKRFDGCLNLYGSNPFTDAADRFILKGGRQRIEVLNPRGGIFLQLTLRAPDGSPPVALQVHDVAIRRRITLTEIHGEFRSNDSLLNWAWNTSVHTLRASTDESYADCPWRERGSYIGDGLVNIHLNRLLSADLSIAKRTFANFGKAQLADGQLQCCAPSWLTKPHEDFTLLWIQAIRDIWAFTGDTDFVAEQWPVIRRIWESPSWISGVDALWDAIHKRVFVDWGGLPSERTGEGNLVINVLRVAAAKACAEMASALDLMDEEKRFTGEANRVSAALCDHLWNDAEGRFNASIGASTSAIHGNILALRHSVGPASRILSYLEPSLRDNFRFGVENGQQSGFAELYFFHFLLPALVDHGRIDLAEDLIRDHYGFIRSLNFPTLPECFHRADGGRGSCCHSWSGAPAIFATESVLGLKQAEPGNPNIWLLDPKSPTHEHADGILPHPQGLIHVTWNRRGNRIEARVRCPQGVSIIPAAHVDIITAAPAVARRLVG